MVNLLRTTHAKYSQNRPDFMEDMIKHFDVFLVHSVYTEWDKTPDCFQKFVTHVYVDIERSFIYQTVEFFIRSKTGMSHSHVSIFKYSFNVTTLH